jgi:hypothetical protein
MEVRTLGRLKAYILVFDRDDTIDYTAFHSALTKLPTIETWWHYLKSTYLIVSRYSATELNTEVIKISPGKLLFIVEVNLKNRNGYLPQEAWDWLVKISQRIEPSPDLLQ